MNLVDAHLHLSNKKYSGNIEELIEDAQNADVKALVSNSVDLETSKETLRLAEKYPRQIYPALGIHPGNVNILKENELEETLTLIRASHQKREVVAIGEIGLDYKYEAKWASQMRVFENMLKLAEELALPAIIHSRGTMVQIAELLPSYNLKGVLLHWFSHSAKALHKSVDQGYFISEGPPVAYSNSIREVVKEVPLTNFLTETDGPVTYRKAPFNGQLTKPSFINTVVEVVAEIKKIEAATAAEQISKNFELFFKVKLV